MKPQFPALSALGAASLAGWSLLWADLSASPQAGVGAPLPLGLSAGSALPAASARIASGTTRVHLVPLFPSKSDQHSQGFMRIINRSDAPGEVTITAIDDEGIRSDSVRLAIGAFETAHFNSDDLEDGAPEKGLSMGTGSAQGNRRLELVSDLEIEVLAYIRSEDGFLTAMHDLVEPRTDGHRVATFNPGRNDRQVSVLRLINPGSAEIRVLVTGIDDSGNQGDHAAGDAEGTVTIALPPGGAREVTAACSSRTTSTGRSTG